MSDIMLPGNFYGHLIRSHQVADAMITLSDYRPHLRTPVHCHELAYFTFLVKGSYREQCGLHHVGLMPYSVMFHGQGDRHDGVAGDCGARCLFVEIGPYWMTRLQEVGSLPGAFVDPGQGRMAWLAFRLYREFLNVGRSADLILEGILLEILGVAAEVLAKKLKKPPWLKQVFELIHDEWQQSLRINGIAERVGVHPVHLSRVFRHFQGTGLGEYLQKYRIKQACRHLESGQQPLATLAGELGFADQAHFTRTFRRWMGLPPAAFRRQFKDRFLKPSLEKQGPDITSA